MENVLCTFSGPNGDILWSLPTVRAISQMVGTKVDFAMMPYYDSLITLIEHQPYVRKAFTVPDWIRWHSNFGDQPWHPPKTVEQGYDRCFHLTYQSHPALGDQRYYLIDFTAHQQGIKLKDPLPFLSVGQVCPDKPTVAYAFNTQYAELKLQFLEHLKAKLPEYRFENVAELPWLQAAAWIKWSVCFVGCRSSNYVLAHGVGQPHIFVYEPHPSRHASGNFGDIFGCPYGMEVMGPFALPPDVQADFAASTVKTWQVKKENVLV
jgi:hypothetical protein